MSSLARTKLPGSALGDSRRTEPPEGKTAPIWAIGGSKGGTGKTFITAALGAQIARQGIAVNLIDADFGAPNLHTFLGISRPQATLGQFFFDRKDLSEILLNTEFDQLHFVAGSKRHLKPSLEYFRKLRFLRQIRELSKQCLTIIDTGAGSTLNTLDFFAISDQAVLVVNPNPASVENMFVFLEAVVLRIVHLTLRKLGLEQAVNAANSTQERRHETVPELVRLAAAEDSSAEGKLRSALEQFQPCLIINKSEQEADLLLGHSLVEVARRCLQLDIYYLGAVPQDSAVGQSLRDMKPFVTAHADSNTATAILLIMDRLLERSDWLRSRV